MNPFISCLLEKNKIDKSSSLRKAVPTEITKILLEAKVTY
jgi:hypothetical protein